MSKWIVTYFESSLVAQTGLTAIVYVRDLSDGSIAVDGATMLEVGSGWYKFDWADGTQASNYDKAKTYVGYCDSQNADSDDRYIPIEFNAIVTPARETGGGGKSEKGDWANRLAREDREFRELMEILALSGVL